MNKQLIRLGDLCKVITKGTTPTTMGFEFVDKGIGFLRVQNIEGGAVNYSCNTLFIDEKTHQAFSRSQIYPGDVLVSIAGTIGRVGVVPEDAPILNCNQAVAIVRTNGEIFRPFLKHWLESDSAQRQMKGATVTGTISNLSLSQLGNLQIPLPPFDEQRRVAAILDKADVIRSKRLKAIRLTDEFLRSTFLEMFGDPKTNPKGWKVEPLEKLVNFTTGKLDSNAAVSGGAYPFFTCAREDFQIDTYSFDCEALLLAGNNASADYSVKHYKGKFNAYQRTYVITMAKPDLTYRYMQYALEMKLQDMKILSKGTNTKYLTLGILNQLPFQVPNMDLQIKFESIKDRVTSNMLKQSDALTLSDDTFESCVNLAFRGEL